MRFRGGEAWVRRGVCGALVLVAAVTVGQTACKKSDDRARATKRAASPHDAAPAPQKPVTLSSAATTDLTTFAPQQGDHVAVLIRFDRLRGTGLGLATEQLLSWMPDHRRVVGKSGTASLDVFEVLLITSSEPSNVVATNMAALRRFPKAKLRALLDNEYSPLTWHRSAGGAFAKLRQSSMFPYDDPRVYMMPLEQWIVMVDPAHVGTLATDAAGSLDDPPPPAPLPAWMRRLPSLSQLGDNKLIALATLNQFPATIRVPLLGTLPAPRRTTIALEQHGTQNVWSGILHFASDAEAQRFANAMQGAGFLLSASGLLPRVLRTPAAEVFQTLALRHDGKAVRWSAATSADSAAAMTSYAATLVANWARGLAGWSFRSPADPKPGWSVYPPRPPSSPPVPAPQPPAATPSPPSRVVP